VRRFFRQVRCRLRQLTWITELPVGQFPDNNRRVANQSPIDARFPFRIGWKAHDVAARACDFTRAVSAAIVVWPRPLVQNSAAGGAVTVISTIFFPPPTRRKCPDDRMWFHRLFASTSLPLTLARNPSRRKQQNARHWLVGKLYACSKRRSRLRRTASAF